MRKITYEKDIHCKPGQTIYFGIDRLYGGWLATTDGDPITLNTLEDAGDEKEIERIEALIESNWGVACTAEDEQYVAEWLNIWGC